MFKQRVFALVILLVFLFSMVAMAATPVPDRESSTNIHMKKPQLFLKPWIQIVEPAVNFRTNDDHTMRIAWRYGGFGLEGSNVKIDIYKGGMLLENLSPSCFIGLNKSGSYDWRIGRSWALLTGHGGGGDFQIKITSLSNSEVSVMSPNFWIGQMVY